MTEPAQTPKRPSPGSREARMMGCCCPTMDNHNGLGRGGDGAVYGWYVTTTCILHGDEAPHA